MKYIHVFSLNSNIENFLLLTEVICAKHHIFKVPGVGFSVAGPDNAKFGVIDLKVFFYCCHSDIVLT